MSIDMSQFLVTFYEESFEGLEIMESELLNLDVGAADSETINTIFRAAHSIKGGSGTFGLNDVASFTHVMETLLDDMREGKREVTQEAVDILLASVDVLHEMLSLLRDEQPLNHDVIAAAQQKLDELLHSGSGDSGEAKPPLTEATGVPAEAEQVYGGWEIGFKPDVEMFKTGNDPVRMMRELDGMGDIKVVADFDRLPLLEDIHTEDSYLSWKITLLGDVSEMDIREVFSWVEDECELTITPIKTATAPATQEQHAEQEITAAAGTTTPELNVDVLEQTFAAIEPQGQQLVRLFYEKLFQEFPQLTPLFEHVTPEKQQAKLLAALKLVIANLRNPDELVKTLTEMGMRHQAYGAETEHYDAVIKSLLAALQELAGEAWSDEAETAWSDALHIISDIMLDAYTDSAAEAASPVAAEPVPETEHAPAPQEPKIEAAVAPKPEPPPKAVPAATKPAADKGAAAAKRKSGSSAETSIRVSIDKVDELINTVGELVITQSMLGQFGELEELTSSHIEKLRDGLGQLERNTRELQEAVMRIRMLPISFVFQRFPRLVHDLSGQLGKHVELKMSGEQTELDKTVMEKIGDPMVHLVRNSMDHGIEDPEIRLAAGKPETGVVNLNAYHQGGNIVIEITDDGAGLNTEKILAKAKASGMVTDDDTLTEEQINDLIFQPGFSTADIVSDVSGRGVGMDVVRRNIRSLGGVVDVKSQAGIGSKFTIRLPLTLAILDGQLVKVGNETYIVPLVSIVESVQVLTERVNLVSGRGEVYKLRDEYIPVVRLYHVFSIPTEVSRLEDGLLVVVEAEGEKVALFVDELLAQQQVVIKSLETNFKKVEGLSGATILGDGTVALILDITGLFDLNKKISTHPEFNQANRGIAQDSQAVDETLGKDGEVAA